MKENKIIKKIIIIGAKGMLGQSLVKVFKEDKNYETIGWDIADIDITNEKDVLKKVKKEKPDTVINAAAYNAVDKAEESIMEFKKARKINGDGPKFLAEACKEIRAVLVHYISDYVFDGKKGKYKENSKTNPISNYGISKELGEKNVKKIGGNYYLIRTSKLFGLPAQLENAKKSFFETMLNLAKKHKELKVVDGERSCFTYVPDLASATKKLVEDKFEYGIYHIVNEKAVTWYEGVLKLFKFAGIKNVEIIPVKPEEFSRPAKRPRASILVNTKFSKLRNYEKALEEWILKEKKKKSSKKRLTKKNELKA